MPTKGTSVKGVRLSDSEWLRLDAEAKRMKMTRNEYVGRMLSGESLCACRVQKTDENVEDSDMVRPLDE